MSNAPQRFSVLAIASIAVALVACRGGIQTIGFDTGSGCESTEPSSSFSTRERVHFRATFEPDLQAGDDITVTVSQDGQRHPGLSSALALDEPTDCIQADLGFLDPGEYNVAVSSRIGTGMSPISGGFEVTGDALERPPVGEVWFGSSYDPDTYEVRGRTESVSVGEPLAFVTQLESHIASDDLMLRLAHDGDVFQHDKVDVPGNEDSRRYGFDGPAPPEPGTWTFDFTDTDGIVLATGEIEVTAPESGSAPPSATASVAPSTGAGEEVSVFDLEAGDCYGDKSVGELLETVIVVDCEQPHVYEVFHVFDHEGGRDAEYPGDKRIVDFGYEACQPEFEDYVDHDFESSIWYIDTVTPSAETWAEGDREILCTIATEKYDEVTGSAEGTGK